MVALTAFARNARHRLAAAQQAPLSLMRVVRAVTLLSALGLGLLSRPASSSAVLTHEYAGCLEAPTIDTSCAVFLAQNVEQAKLPAGYLTNLAFASPAWKLADWQYYLLQDGVYLLNYSDKVLKPLRAACGKELKESDFKFLEDRLGGFDAAAYETRFGLAPGSVAKAAPSPILQAYFKLYEEAAKSSCQSLLATMMPCQCIYPAIASRLFLQAKRGKLDSKFHNKAMHQEFQFFGHVAPRAGSGGSGSGSGSGSQKPPKMPLEARGALSSGASPAADSTSSGLSINTAISRVRGSFSSP